MKKSIESGSCEHEYEAPSWYDNEKYCLKCLEPWYFIKIGELQDKIKQLESNERSKLLEKRVICIAEDIRQRVLEFDEDNVLDFAYAAVEYMDCWVTEFQELFPDHDLGDPRRPNP